MDGGLFREDLNLSGGGFLVWMAEREDSGLALKEKTREEEAGREESGIVVWSGDRISRRSFSKVCWSSGVSSIGELVTVTGSSTLDSDAGFGSAGRAVSIAVATSASFGVVSTAVFGTGSCCAELFCFSTHVGFAGRQSFIMCPNSRQ